ncbi:MAG: hypothetical protein ABI207_00030 [Crocinitomicaceae bacterium]
MKKHIILTLLLFVSYAQESKAQTTIPTDTVEWKYCYLHDIFSYVKSDLQVIGTDTLSLYKIYKNQILTDTIFLKEGRDTTFYYKNGIFHFLFSNDAELGDVWHPLNTTYYGSDTCNLTFVVVGKDSLYISGKWLNRIKLNIQINSSSMEMFVVEKIGVFGGGHNFGMIYNFLYGIDCQGHILNSDSPAARLLSYRSDVLNYSVTYNINCFLDIDENSITEEEPLIKRTDNRIEVIWNEKDVVLELYNISGQKIRSAQGNTLYLPQEQGIYFLHIQQNTDSRVVKLAN